METKITKHFIKIGSLKYFRGNASDVDLCSYGEKKDPIGAKAYLSVQNKVKREHLEGRITRPDVINVNWNSASSSDLSIDGVLKFFGIGVTGQLKKGSDFKNADLKLVSFGINEGPLKTMLNKDANGTRNYLADEGKDGRIVSKVFVVMEAELANQVGGIDLNAGIKVLGSSLAVTIPLSRNRSETITLDKGTVFAYRLHKVKKWNKGKTKIENMEDDYKGMG